VNARRLGAVAYIGVAVMVMLAGCAPSSPDDLDANRAVALQESVIGVATLAADGDIEGAVLALDALQADVDEAVAADELSAERLAIIQDAIDLVRVDLAGLVPEPSPSPSVTDEQPEKPGKPGKGNKPEKPGKP